MLDFLLTVLKNIMNKSLFTICSNIASKYIHVGDRVIAKYSDGELGTIVIKEIWDCFLSMRGPHKRCCGYDDKHRINIDLPIQRFLKINTQQGS